MSNQRGPRTYPNGSEITVTMPNPDASPTVVTPLPALRDAMRTSNRPENVHDLPLWRPGISAPPAAAAPPTPAEQTEIGTVAAQVVGHAYKRQFDVLRNEMRAEPRKVIDDLNDIVAASLMDMHAFMAELDGVAEAMGFRSAAVRRLGKGLVTGDMTAAAVLEELHAIG
jgi:hypothetical protein